MGERWATRPIAAADARDDAIPMLAQALMVATAVVPVTAMLLATFAAFWLHDEERERRATARRPR